MLCWCQYFCQKLTSHVILCRFFASYFDGFTKIWLFTARNVLDNILGLQKLDDIIGNLLFKSRVVFEECEKAISTLKIS